MGALQFHRRTSTLVYTPKQKIRNGCTEPPPPTPGSPGPRPLDGVRTEDRGTIPTSRSDPPLRPSGLGHVTVPVVGRRPSLCPSRRVPVGTGPDTVVPGRSGPGVRSSVRGVPGGAGLPSGGLPRVTLLPESIPLIIPTIPRVAPPHGRSPRVRLPPP